MGDSQWRTKYLADTATYLGGVCLAFVLLAVTIRAVVGFIDGTVRIPSIGSGGAAILGTLVGSSVPLWWSWHRRRVERRGELKAMISEHRRCMECLNSLIQDQIDAPPYRLPAAILKLSLPKLVGDGALSSNETGTMVDYLDAIEEANRRLERCALAEAGGSITFQILVSERSQLARKADEWLNHAKGSRWHQAALFDAAWAVLRRLDDGRPIVW